jgi:ectoine hydroxylase-related dioxygenase (phytanoyl-CoA dioxygenase family)
MTTMESRSVNESIDGIGFGIHPNAVCAADCELLCDEIQRLASLGDGPYCKAGLRNLLRESTCVRSLACSNILRQLIQSVLKADAFAVRALWFDKRDGANWLVPWHQDVMIAVAERADAPGYGPWSIKSRVDHVRPPVVVLERMASIRIHLDPCGEDNGPLQVIPGSHRGGILDDVAIDAAVSRAEPVTCVCERGDAIVMRPLLLHRSSKADQPCSRRVLHLEYADCELAAPLEWFDRVS